MGDEVVRANSVVLRARADYDAIGAIALVLGARHIGADVVLGDRVPVRAGAVDVHPTAGAGRDDVPLPGGLAPR